RNARPRPASPQGPVQRGLRLAEDRERPAWDRGQFHAGLDRPLHRTLDAPILRRLGCHPRHMQSVVQNYRSGDLTVAETPPPQLRDRSVLVRTRWSIISAGTE